MSVESLLLEMARHVRQGRPAEVERCKRELRALGHVFAEDKPKVERAVSKAVRETRKA